MNTSKGGINLYFNNNNIIAWELFWRKTFFVCVHWIYFFIHIKRKFMLQARIINFNIATELSVFIYETWLRSSPCSWHRTKLSHSTLFFCLSLHSWVTVTQYIALKQAYIIFWNMAFQSQHHMIYGDIFVMLLLTITREWERKNQPPSEGKLKYLRNNIARKRKIWKLFDFAVSLAMGVKMKRWDNLSFWYYLVPAQLY